MALVKFGGGITAMSGSIAGNTFARNRFGYYSRSRTKPVNSNSAGQTQMRTILAYLAEAWHEQLSAAQRTAWETYASAIAMKNRLGETIKLTGFQHFIRSNSLTLQQTNAMVKDGPTLLSLPDKDPTLAITASAATQLISVTFDNTLWWAQSPNRFLALFQGRPQLATRNFFNGPWRRTGAIAGAGTPPTSPQTKTAVFTLVAGQKTWLYARACGSGTDCRVSEPMEVNCIVGA